MQSQSQLSSKLGLSRWEAYALISAEDQIAAQVQAKGKGEAPAGVGGADAAARSQAGDAQLLEEMTEQLGQADKVLELLDRAIGFSAEQTLAVTQSTERLDTAGWKERLGEAQKNLRPEDASWLRNNTSVFLDLILKAALSEDAEVQKHLQEKLHVYGAALSEALQKLQVLESDRTKILNFLAALNTLLTAHLSDEKTPKATLKMMTRQIERGRETVADFLPGPVKTFQALHKHFKKTSEAFEFDAPTKARLKEAAWTRDLATQLKKIKETEDKAEKIAGVGEILQKVAAGVKGFATENLTNIKVAQLQETIGKLVPILEGAKAPAAILEGVANFGDGIIAVIQLRQVDNKQREMKLLMARLADLRAKRDTPLDPAEQQKIEANSRQLAASSTDLATKRTDLLNLEKETFASLSRGDDGKSLREVEEQLDTLFSKDRSLSEQLRAALKDLEGAEAEIQTIRAKKEALDSEFKRLQASRQEEVDKLMQLVRQDVNVALLRNDVKQLEEQVREQTSLREQLSGHQLHHFEVVSEILTVEARLDELQTLIERGNAAAASKGVQSLRKLPEQLTSSMEQVVKLMPNPPEGLEDIQQAFGTYGSYFLAAVDTATILDSWVKGRIAKRGLNLLKQRQQETLAAVGGDLHQMREEDLEAYRMRQEKLEALETKLFNLRTGGVAKSIDVLDFVREQVNPLLGATAQEALGNVFKIVSSANVSQVANTLQSARRVRELKKKRERIEVQIDLVKDGKPNPAKQKKLHQLEVELMNVVLDQRAAQARVISQGSAMIQALGGSGLDALKGFGIELEAEWTKEIGKLLPSVFYGLNAGVKITSNGVQIHFLRKKLALQEKRYQHLEDKRIKAMQTTKADMQRLSSLQGRVLTREQAVAPAREHLECLEQEANRTQKQEWEAEVLKGLLAADSETLGRAKAHLEKLNRRESSLRGQDRVAQRVITRFLELGGAPLSQAEREELVRLEASAAEITNEEQRELQQLLSQANTTRQQIRQLVLEEVKSSLELIISVTELAAPELKKIVPPEIMAYLDKLQISDVAAAGQAVIGIIKLRQEKQEIALLEKRRKLKDKEFAAVDSQSEEATTILGEIRALNLEIKQRKRALVDEKLRLAKTGVESLAALYDRLSPVLKTAFGQSAAVAGQAIGGGVAVLDLVLAGRELHVELEGVREIRRDIRILDAEHSQIHEWLTEKGRIEGNLKRIVGETKTEKLETYLSNKLKYTQLKRTSRAEDDARALALEAQKEAITALKTRIRSAEGDTSALEAELAEMNEAYTQASEARKAKQAEASQELGKLSGLIEAFETLVADVEERQVLRHGAGRWVHVQLQTGDAEKQPHEDTAVLSTIQGVAEGWTQEDTEAYLEKRRRILELTDDLPDTDSQLSEAEEEISELRDQLERATRRADTVVEKKSRRARDGVGHFQTLRRKWKAGELHPEAVEQMRQREQAFYGLHAPELEGDRQVLIDRLKAACARERQIRAKRVHVRFMHSEPDLRERRLMYKQDKHELLEKLATAQEADVEDVQHWLRQLHETNKAWMDKTQDHDAKRLVREENRRIRKTLFWVKRAVQQGQPERIEELKAGIVSDAAASSAALQIQFEQLAEIDELKRDATALEEKGGVRGASRAQLDALTNHWIGIKKRNIKWKWRIRTLKEVKGFNRTRRKLLKLDINEKVPGITQKIIRVVKAVAVITGIVLTIAGLSAIGGFLLGPAALIITAVGIAVAGGLWLHYNKKLLPTMWQRLVNTMRTLVRGLQLKIVEKRTDKVDKMEGRYQRRLTRISARRALYQRLLARAKEGSRLKQRIEAKIARDSEIIDKLTPLVGDKEALEAHLEAEKAQVEQLVAELNKTSTDLETQYNIVKFLSRYKVNEDELLETIVKPIQDILALPEAGVDGEPHTEQALKRQTMLRTLSAFFNVDLEAADDPLKTMVIAMMGPHAEPWYTRWQQEQAAAAAAA